MKKRLVLFLALLLLLSLAACGEPEQTQGTSKPSGSVIVPGSTGSTASGGENTYVFAPPTDNYYVETDTYTQARVGSLYTYWDKEDPTYSYHANAELQGIWWYYEGQWSLGWDYTWEEYAEEMGSPAYIFSAMEEGLMRLLRAFGSEDRLFEDYYLGMETVAGVNCWVFDSKGINTLYCKYWVDPSNGCVLKFDHYESGDYSEEVRVYNLNYKELSMDLRPAEYEDPCNHWDENVDGACDYCGRSFAKTQLSAPVIHIDEDGDISWHVEYEWRNTVKYILRLNGQESETTKDGYGQQPKHGDRFQVKAIADPRGVYADSEWSQEFVFEYASEYEFLNIGLETRQEEALAKYFGDFAPGAYYLFGDLTYLKCENGDLIVWDEDGDHQVYTLEGYHYYKLHKNNNDHNEYDHYFFRDDKTSFYSALCSCVNAFSWCTREDQMVYADAAAFLSAQGVFLQGPGQIAQAGGSYNLLNYREYSDTVDRSYIVTGFMHPQSRYLEWLPSYGDKVLYWEVRYINDPHVYVEGSLFIQFTEDFDHKDFESVRGILMGQGLEPLYSDSFGAVVENGYNSFDGRLPVYYMAYPEEEEYWYDTYKMVGYVDKVNGYSFPFSFQADYLYKYWYDGGTNATYVRRLDGLWRVTPDGNGGENWELMISP